MAINLISRISLAFFTTLSVINANAQCSIVVALPDTVHICQTLTMLNPVVTGTNSLTRVQWTPSTGLSDTTILNPVVTPPFSAQKYYVTIYSVLQPNLVNNPAFTAGNTGFTNGYQYHTSGPTNAAYYFINTNPQSINPLWPPIGDHTTGAGNMLILDAATSPNVSCWCQSVPVAPNTYYQLSAWTAKLYPPSAKLKFSINGTQIGTIHSVDSINWTKYEDIWFSGPATSANICISNTNLTGYGNDFAIDDITFHQLCVATDSVVVDPTLVPPAIAINVSPNDTVCANTEVHFTASVTNGGSAPQYQWYKNGNPIPGAMSVSYHTTNFSSGDYFTCELISNAPCVSSTPQLSAPITMVILPVVAAQVGIIANPGLVLSPWQTVTFTATPLNGGTSPTYQWLRNGQLVIGAISDTWGANNLDNGDVISVVLFSSDPCAQPKTDTSIALTINIKTDVNTLAANESPVLYPNPNKGKFTISNIPLGDVKIEIVNSIGQVVYKEQLKSHSTEHTISTNIPLGIYILNFISEDDRKSAVFSVY